MTSFSIARAASCGAAALVFIATNSAVFADVAASTAVTADASASSNASTPPQLKEIEVTAQRLNEARTSIETQTGASTYTIDNEAIKAMPGGDNNQLNQILLQAPDVVQDSFGQIHVRADHNDLQYRLNGIILPEGISVFSQTLSPWLISSLKLITGALPAEYGLRTAGVIDLTTNSGLLTPGGEVSVYGGSHSTFEPAAEYGGSDGKYTYYVTSDYKQNNLGIESPDTSANPLHDHTTQIQGFGYFEDIIDTNNRLSLIMGISDNEFQIPNQVGLQPTLGLDVNGQTAFLSNDLNEPQHELAEYAIVSWQHSEGALNWQTSLSARYTSLHFAPDWVGDLLYNGIAQDAFKDDTAIGWQTDASYKLGDVHTVRAGLYYQHDSSESDTTFAGAADQCSRHADQQCALVRHRQRHTGAADSECLSAGRVETAFTAHRQLRSAIRSLQRVFQWRPAQSACQLCMGVPNRHDVAWRLLAIFHPASVRTRRLRDLHKFAGTTAVPPAPTRKTHRP